MTDSHLIETALAEEVMVKTNENVVSLDGGGNDNASKEDNLTKLVDSVAKPPLKEETSEQNSVWIPLAEKDQSRVLSEGLRPSLTLQCHVLPLFSVHVGNEFFDTKNKDKNNDGYRLLNNEHLLNMLHNLEKNHCFLSRPSLVTHLCHEAASQALYRHSLLNQVQLPLQCTTEKDDPPHAVLPLPTDCPPPESEVPWISAAAQRELLYSSMYTDREKTILTLKTYSFRILRNLNICFPLWGSHYNSFLWHSQCILNALRLHEVSKYILIFEDIMEQIALCLWEAKEKMNQYSQTSGCTQYNLKKRKTSLKSNGEAVRGKGKPSGVHLAEDPSMGNSHTDAQDYAARCARSVHRNQYQKILSETKETSADRELLSAALLSCLIYQVDTDVLSRSLFLLDILRHQCDSDFTPFMKLHEALKSFCSHRAFRGEYFSTLHSLTGLLNRFPPVPDLIPTTARRGRRGRVITQPPLPPSVQWLDCNSMRVSTHRKAIRREAAHVSPDRKQDTSCKPNSLFSSTTQYTFDTGMSSSTGDDGTHMLDVDDSVPTGDTTRY